MKKAHIIQKATNEFIFEFATQADASELKEDAQFKYKDVTHRVIRFYPGFSGPAIYSFLVIAEAID